MSGYDRAITVYDMNLPTHVDGAVNGEKSQEEQVGLPLVGDEGAVGRKRHLRKDEKGQVVYSVDSVVACSED